MQAVINGKPWLKDALAVRKCWDEDAYRLTERGGKELCFAIMWDDGVTVPHPPIMPRMHEEGISCRWTQRFAVRGSYTYQKFTAFSVIDWKPIKHNEINKVIVSNFLHPEFSTY